MATSTSANMSVVSRVERVAVITEARTIEVEHESLPRSEHKSLSSSVAAVGASDGGDGRMPSTMASGGHMELSL